MSESKGRRVSGPGHGFYGRTLGELDLSRESNECLVRVAGKMGEEGLAESGKSVLGGGIFW